jgi:hypothetical protein
LAGLAFCQLNSSFANSLFHFGVQDKFITYNILHAISQDNVALKWHSPKKLDFMEFNAAKSTFTKSTSNAGNGNYYLRLQAISALLTKAFVAQ